MVRKLLLQVLIGWAKPLYTSLVASTPALHTAAAKICTFFSLYYILACVVLQILFQSVFQQSSQNRLLTAALLCVFSRRRAYYTRTTSICDKSNSAPTAAAPHCMNRRQAQCGLKYEKKCNLEKKKNNSNQGIFFKKK